MGAKDIFDSHIASMPQSIPMMNVSIDINRMDQIIKRTEQLVKIDYADNIKQHKKDKDEDERKMNGEAKQKKESNEDFLLKVAKHLSIEKRRNVFWYDANCS